MVHRTTGRWVLAAVAVLGVCLFFGWRSSIEARGGERASCNGEGTWIGVAPDGNIYTETIVPDSSGSRFQWEVTGLGINGNDPTFGGLFPDVGGAWLPGRGEGVRIARNTYRFVGYSYGLIVNDGAPNDYVYIRVDTGTAEFPDCYTQNAVDNVAIYTADQDADQDGIPDAGEEPVLYVPGLPVQFKRVSP